MLTQSIQDELKYRASTLDHAGGSEITGRLVSLLDWMDAQPEIKRVLDSLQKVLQESQPFTNQVGARRQWPKANTPEEIASVGMELMRMCKRPEASFPHVLMKIGLRGSGADDLANIGLKKYVEPLFNYILRSLPPDSVHASATTGSISIPPTLTESLQALRKDYPDAKKLCFIMMRFGKTAAHEEVVRAIKDTMEPLGITALRADDKEYNDDLFGNIQTYVYGCAFGVAVFERIESEDFNPNVSLELGIMFGLRKPVLLLKDKTMKTLHTDLVGKLYRAFDPQAPSSTIPSEIRRWLEDKNLA